MTIGVISDTHGFMDLAVVEKHFADCDQIWHAGDIGTNDILDNLEKLAPVKAVWGNIDGGEIRKICPEYIVIKEEGVSILLIHIANRMPRYTPQVRELIQLHRPDMLVCGHSHILKVQRDKDNELLYLNPGAAGRHGFHKVKTMIKLELREGKIENLRVIEIGKRGKA